MQQKFMGLTISFLIQNNCNNTGLLTNKCLKCLLNDNKNRGQILGVCFYKEMIGKINISSYHT